MGYQASGADLAFVLRNEGKVDVLTPTSNPDPERDEGWCFPDSDDGILDAVRRGATHLWANTVLFSSHPLQISSLLDRYQDHLHIIGQPPSLVDKFDDKEYINDLLRARGSFMMRRSWTIDLSNNLRISSLPRRIPYPAVGKPIRGRVSQVVRVCSNIDELQSHLHELSRDTSRAILEELLAGEEATITVMPPSKEFSDYWSMSSITRFNHADGIAPYKGVVAVTANSRPVSWQGMAKDKHYQQATEQCVEVARLM